MERRNFVKAAGALVGTAAVGGAGLLTTTGGASAGGGFYYSDSVGISSDDGTVEYVAIYGDSIVTWKGFEVPAQYFHIDIDLTVLDSDGNILVDSQNIHETDLVDLDNADWGNYDESLSGAGTRGSIESGIGLDENGEHDPAIDWHLVQDPDAESAGEYGLPENPVDAAELEVDGDGETGTFTLKMESTYSWYEADAADTGAETIHSKTFTSKLDVEVENIETQAGTSDGGGEDGATGA